MKAIIPIGISGSGKSRLYKTEYSDIVKICPDDIRLELTGDISDQSKNKEVFKIVDDRIAECVSNNTDFYLDATNLNTNYREKLTRELVEKGVVVHYELLKCNPIVSWFRIKLDIIRGINRSKVGWKVIKKQRKMYKESMKHFRKEGACVIVHRYAKH